MNYAEIKKLDIANGEGIRVSLFVSGCTHHCKGCFNAETWDFHFGKPFTEETEAEILEALSPDHINGLTLLGGEPMEPVNQRVLCPFIKKVRETYPHKDIWCYTGYLYDKDLVSPVGRAKTEVTLELLSMIDFLVDGPFIEAQKDITLAFRGSRNQRIINLRETRATGTLSLWEQKSHTAF